VTAFLDVDELHVVLGLFGHRVSSLLKKAHVFFL